MKKRPRVSETKIVLRCPRALREKLKRYAVAEGRTEAGAARWLLEQALRTR